MNISLQNVRLLIFFCSIALYIYSLFLPGLLFAYHEPTLGYALLLEGWLGVSMLEFGWFANLAFFSAVRAYNTNITRCKWAAIIAILIGLTSYHAKEVIFTFASNTTITSLGAGFYVWMLSFLILLSGCFIPQKPNPSVK